MITKPDKKTGVFRRGEDDSIVVLWRDREVMRYPSMSAFVEAHLAGQSNLQKKQDELLEDEYRDA